MIWYPYAQMKTMDEPIHITKAQGIYLYSHKNKYIDTTSSWWSVIHGYNNQEINQVIKEQVDEFSHVMLGGLTHKPALDLSHKLKSFLPGSLNHCFYSDSGSVGVEVALKMAIQYHFNQGKCKKKEIIALTHAYHGDTFKTMAVGDDPDYHLAFPDKEGVHHINPNVEELKMILEKHHETIACLIVEPLLQGAGGMRMYGVDFLESARALCDQYNILLIFDEVATGFGRTGHRFVSDLVCPDIVVLGKALTAGYIGHAVTLANDKVFDGFYSDKAEHAFMHGPTFMGNPLACRAALKSIEIFEREDYISKIKHIEKLLKDAFKDFNHDAIKEIRILGAYLCIEVYNKENLKGFKKYALDRGVHSRPFIDYMYAMFPYIIKDRELHLVIDVYKSWFKEVE
ncbi:adenosylmethionine--8-amino-7-oxononanoate transaminase [Acidaminobacter sp. JC074]|uniref:adenosylmethionine--8-amino-7-oxononanoate transaminase n=1 Tax=Acidaminobacter sp. JC074 TaxID=2530199 RepID=UPI001F119078|nr:adenosylmethionine--8-amino-7-oxononanoate transaminase [Acidaminobacter sp. JC074]MCH4888867.1 adenosylmethionine--8-amino-7-oxononanoate transaminase [Acidaminobacter sp. JC074]